MMSGSSRHAVLQSFICFITIVLLAEHLLPGYKAAAFGQEAGTYMFRHQKFEDFVSKTPPAPKGWPEMRSKPWTYKDKKKKKSFDNVVATFQEARRVNKVLTDSVERIGSAELTFADLLSVLTERWKIQEVEAIVDILADFKVLLEENNEYDDFIEEINSREDHVEQWDPDEQWGDDAPDLFREPSAGASGGQYAVFEQLDQQREEQEPPPHERLATPLAVGDLVLARDSAYSYFAEVESISLTEGTCAVKFLDNNVSDDVKLSDLRQVDPLRDCVYLGANVMALWGDEDTYRPAEVVEVGDNFTNRTAVVRFNSSQGREERTVDILQDLQFSAASLEVGSIVQVEYDGPTDLYWGQITKVSHQKKTAEVLYLESNTYEPDIEFQRLRYS